MKTCNYQKRFYRDWIKARDLKVTRITVKETDLQILTDKPIDESFLRSRVKLYRSQVEDYITKDKRFLTSLKPVEVELNAKPIVKAMAKAAKKANVGPMAAVAGAIAGFLGRDILNRGYKDVIIENGGDIFLSSRKVRMILVYSGKSKLWQSLYLRINPQDTPTSICTSSGTIGHSLSFGYADSVVVLSKNPSLADAVATACCNLVTSKENSGKAIDLARSIKGVTGIIVIIKNTVSSWGKVEFV